MNANRSGITVAGTLIGDVFYEIDTYPKLGYLTNVRGTSFNIGGSGNLTLDLAKLDKDLKVKICAIVGEDATGEKLLSVLKQYPNIDTADISVYGDSSCTMVMNAADTKQRTFFYIPGASDVFCEDYIKWDNIDTKIFHLEYLLLMEKVDSPDADYGTHGARILKNARERGMITSVDMVSEDSSRVRDVVIPALKYTDICCINEVETKAVTGIDLEENGTLSREKCLEAARKIKEYGVSKWIVIHAPKCGYGYDCETDELVYVESIDKPKGYIKGTTGAGDAYCSGILYGAHQDMTLEESMRLARACATCSLSENNGTDGMRSYEEIIAEFGK